MKLATLIEIERLLSLTADRSNWEIKTEFGPYGSYTVYIWHGDENLQGMAEELIYELEEERKE